MTGGELTHANPWFGGPNGLHLICPWETEDLNNVVFFYFDPLNSCPETFHTY